MVRTRAPAVECGPGGQPGRAGQAASAIRHSSKSPWKASKAGGLRIRKWFIHRAPGGGYNRNFHNFLTTQVGLYVYQAARIIWYRRLIVRPIGSLRRSGSFLQEWDREFGWRSKPTGVCWNGWSPSWRVRYARRPDNNGWLRGRCKIRIFGSTGRLGSRRAPREPQPIAALFYLGHYNNTGSE